MWRAFSRQLQTVESLASRSLLAAETSVLSPLTQNTMPSVSTKRPSDTAPFSSSSSTPNRKQPGETTQWELLRSEGYNINPCNSKLHPAYMEAGIEPDSEEERSVQEAYTPESTCFGCGTYIILLPFKQPLHSTLYTTTPSLVLPPTQ